jgi:hypothetical protein
MSATAPPRTTPAATATTNPATVAFTDDYSSSTSGLPKAGYRNGEYHIVVAADRAPYVVYPKAIGPVANDAYEVSARRVSGPSDLVMGVVFRFVDKDNFSFFEFSNAGRYAFFVIENGTIHGVGTPGETTAIREDVANMIQVVGMGTSFTALVNGQPVATAEIEDAAPGGAFGLFVLNPSETESAEAAFDNFKVTVG